MVRIRLRRTGARNQPSWRIVAADKAKPRDGRFLEILGHYNARTEPATIDVNEERLFHWLQNGADPSDSVIRVLKSIGTWDRWERLKDGEPLEKLLEEAAAEAEEREIDPRTKRQDMARKKPSKKARAKAEAGEAETEEAEAEEEPEAEAVEEEVAAEEAEEADEEEGEEVEESEEPEEEEEPEETEESEESEETEEGEEAEQEGEDDESEDDNDEEEEERDKEE